MNKILNLNGCLVSYRIVGTGSPIILLHGFLEDLTMWDRVSLLLQTSHTVLAIDLPGHGLSDCQMEAKNMANMARVVKAVCDTEKIANPIVFGHSMGGYVALELIKIIDCDVALVHSNFWADSAAKKNDRNRVIEVVKDNLLLFVNTAIPNLFYSENRHVCQAEISRLIVAASKMKPEAVVAITKGMRDRLDNRMVLNQKKIAIIQGVNDPIIPLDQMNKAIISVQIQPYYHLIEHCGHMGFIEKTEEFHAAILAIIDKFSDVKPNY